MVATRLGYLARSPYWKLGIEQMKGDAKRSTYQIQSFDRATNRTI